MAKPPPPDFDPFRARVAEMTSVAWTSKAFSGRYSSGSSDRFTRVAGLIADVAPLTAVAGQISDDEFDRLVRDGLRRDLQFLYPEVTRQLASDLFASIPRWPSPYDPDAWRLYVTETIVIAWVNRAFSVRMAGGSFVSHLDRVAALIGTVAPQVPGELTDGEFDLLLRTDLRRELFFLDDMPVLRRLARDLIAECARWQQ